MAFTQTNVRLIAGYSSVAQLGFITLGIFSLRPDGADGAVLQMVNHGLVVGGRVHGRSRSLYERTRTEDLTEMGGQAMRAPVLAALFLVVTMANLAIPGRRTSSASSTSSTASSSRRSCSPSSP